MSHILEVDSIQLQFHNRTVLSNIYLKCETGKITGILGRNGEGKSCLMNIIYGNLTCESSVRFDQMVIRESFKRPDLMVYLPQFNFIPKSLSLGRAFQDFELDFTLFLDRFPEFRPVMHSSIGSLSGGEKRFIELYLIVKSASKFAMLDEPFTHLNPIQIEKAKTLLLEEKHNKGFLITDHLYHHIIELADDLYLLVNGQTILTKSIRDIELFRYAELK